MGSGVTRDYYVQAYRSGDPTGTKSDWGGPNSGTRVAAISNATAPTSVSATAGNSSATVNWSGATNAVKYRVWWSTSISGNSVDPSANFDAQTTSTSATFSLNNGTTYYFWVSASNTNDVWTSYSSSPRGQATPSAPVVVAPAITSGPSISWSSGNNFTLSATASNATNIRFQVQFANNNGGPVLNTQEYVMGAGAGSTTTGAQQYSWARTRARANNSTTGLSSEYTPTDYTGWA
jgi:serine protease